MQNQLEGVFCRAVEVPLAELKLLLDAVPSPLAAAPEVVSAQAVYDDLSGYVLYVPFVGDDCDRHTTEALTTVTKLRAFLAASGVDAPPPLRPDAPQTPPGYGLGSLGPILGLGLAAYIIAKLSKWRGK